MWDQWGKNIPRYDPVISCVRLNEERNKQDKTGLFIPNS